MAMKNSAFLTLASIALVSGCSAKQEAPQSADNLSAVAPGAAAKPASDDGIFKYTITTDIDAESDQIEILVAMNSVKGQYPVRYDLDCEGDGEFEHQGLTENKRCLYKKNSGRHQIWVRGEIPGMFLCARRDKNLKCDSKVPEDQKHPLCNTPLDSDHSAKAVILIDS